MLSTLSVWNSNSTVIERNYDSNLFGQEKQPVPISDTYCIPIFSNTTKCFLPVSAQKRNKNAVLSFRSYWGHYNPLKKKKNFCFVLCAESINAHSDSKRTTVCFGGTFLHHFHNIRAVQVVTQKSYFYHHWLFIDTSWINFKWICHNSTTVKACLNYKGNLSGVICKWYFRKWLMNFLSDVEWDVTLWKSTP